jgi:uncharacterized protein YjbI with pentapeptide repeats
MNRGDLIAHRILKCLTLLTFKEIEKYDGKKRDSMIHGDDQLIQATSGLWIPKSPRTQRDQQPAQQVSSEDPEDPESVQDWKAHWEAQEQPWRREPEIDLKRQQFLRQQLDSETDEIAPFDGISLERADLEWLVKRYKEKIISNIEQKQGLNLQYANLDTVDLTYLPLEEANFTNANLVDVDFTSANLKGTYFWSANLTDAVFTSANLESAKFWSVNLAGTDFRDANLAGANFRFTRITNVSFKDATIVTIQGVGLTVADVSGWDEKSLSTREWSQVKLLGDETIAKKRKNEERKCKDATIHFDDYFAATRAYRQVSTALDGMGRKEEAETFAYRGQVMQRKMLWWSIWQKKRTFRQRLADGRAWLFSWLLALLSGYGYRFGRSFSWYVGVLLTFAWLYLHISQNVPPHSTIPDHLSWFDACILSISDMVGRGFFRQDVTLSDPYAGWSVLEGMIGVFMDVLLISTLTQRLFKK